MPIFNSSVSNATSKLINPVAEQIVFSIIKLLGVGSIFDENIYISNPNSSASNYKIDGKSKVPRNRCDVEVVANNNPADNIFGTQTARDSEAKFNIKGRIVDTQHILLDPVSMIYLHEASTPCSVDLNFTFQIMSIDQMDVIANRLNSVFQSSDDSYQNHSVRMSYGIPDQTLLLLHRLWKLKTHSNNLNVPFNKYLGILSNGIITHEVNRDDPEDIAVVIAKEAVRIVGRTNNTLGVYDANVTNEKTDFFTHTFTYQFVFNKPTVLNTEFPIAIDGQYVPSEYISKGEMADLESLNNRQSSISFENASEQQRITPLTLSYPWIKFPVTDDWVGVNVHFPSFLDRWLPRFSGVCQVDENNTISISVPNEIFPILGSLDEVITAAFDMTTVEEHQKMEALFQIMLFSNDHMVSAKNLDVSTDLTLTYSTADPTRIYRIAVCQQKDIRTINYKYFKLLFEYSWYFKDFIFANLSYFVQNKWLEVVHIDGFDTLGLSSVGGNRPKDYDPQVGLTPEEKEAKGLDRSDRHGILVKQTDDRDGKNHSGSSMYGPGKKIIIHNYTLRVKKVQ